MAEFEKKKSNGDTELDRKIGRELECLGQRWRAQDATDRENEMCRYVSRRAVKCSPRKRGRMKKMKAKKEGVRSFGATDALYSWSIMLNLDAMRLTLSQMNKAKATPASSHASTEEPLRHSSIRSGK